MAYTTINKSNLHMKVNLHSGTGSDRNITGIGFQPDFTIVKRRDTTGVWYNTDIVRGAGKQMYLNETGGMGASPSTREITGFNSDGFNLGEDIGVNASGGTFVSYNFLANNTTGSSNTDGNITSTVSANTTSGFSIVKYTGSASNITVGHGLGAVPKMIIIKNLSSSTSWTVYHESIGNAKRLVLNNANAEEDTNQFSFGTSPTSTVFALGGGYADVCTSGADYIAYCFADVKGFSKFGSYTGNGNADGTFIYTGFKPAFVMTKRTDSSDWWGIWDSKRDSFNEATKNLRVNASDAESPKSIDILSNGFKLKNTDPATNASGGTYIYMAFAEAPLVGSNGVTAKAR